MRQKNPPDRRSGELRWGGHKEADNQTCTAESPILQPSRSETADDYDHVIAASGRWRVIRCRSDIQFIAQKRACGDARKPWGQVAYVATESGLQHVLTGRWWAVSPRDAAAIVATLVAAGAVDPEASN